MSEPDNEPSLVGQQVGKYTVIRQLGEGGMGVVYEATRSDIGSRVALKVLRTQFAMNKEIAVRFFNEARASNIVEHPSIVKVFDYGQLASGAAYLAMEYLNGESLHTRLQRERRLSETETVRIGRQIATALAAAHAKQVVHRDLKPENIMLVPDVETPSGERAKILDFGIAKLARQHAGRLRTDAGAVMGTPIYMSPEQCRGGKSVGERADVYALGVMLFEMLAGRTPFVAEEAGEYIGMHLFKDPPPVAQLAPGLAPRLQRLIDAMLLKEPQQRPAMVVVAAVLRELSMNSSDVDSFRAIVAESKLDIDTQPFLRVPEPGLDVAYGKTLPAVSMPPKKAGGVVDRLTPLRPTIDPLGDTLPGQASLQAAVLRPKEPRPAGKSPGASAVGGEALPSARSSPNPSPQPAGPAVVVDSEQETLKPGQAHASALALAEAKSESQGSGSAASQLAGAPPPGLGDSEIPTVKPGQLNRAQFRGDLAVAANAPAAPFQPAHIRSGAHLALDGPTAKLGGASFDALDTRRRSLTSRWRRLRYQLRSGARSWLGITSSGPSDDATRTSRPWTPWLVGIAALLLGASALFLMLRSPEGVKPPVAPTPFIASTAPAASAASATPAAPAASAVPPTSPPSEAKVPPPPAAPTEAGLPDTLVESRPPAAPPPLPADLVGPLGSAEKKAQAGQLATAHREARGAARKFHHGAAWLAAGRYACGVPNAKAANEALSHLLPDSDESRRYRAELIAACQALGLQFDTQGQFGSIK